MRVTISVSSPALGVELMRFVFVMKLELEDATGSLEAFLWRDAVSVRGYRAVGGWGAVRARGDDAGGVVSPAGAVLWRDSGGRSRQPDDSNPHPPHTGVHLSPRGQRGCVCPQIP